MSPPPAERPSDQRVRTAIVVGGGITGLVAARRLAQRGVAVTLVESTGRLGGQIHTVDFCGIPTEIGAEAVHLAMPVLVGLIDELGLTNRLTRAEAHGTWLATRLGLRKLPEGVGPAGPTKLEPVIRSGILSPQGMARAGMEPVIARAHKITEDMSVGAFVTQRFGREVADQFVDPLLGSLHAGDIHRLSLRAVTPQLAVVAREGRSLVLSPTTRKNQPSTAGATFASFSDGLATLTNHVLDDTGVEIRLRHQVEQLSRDPDTGTYHLQNSAGRLVADAVVLAVPARIASQLLAGVAPRAADQLARGRAASVATVLLAYRTSDVAATKALEGTGLLLPSTAGRTLKAATFLTTKWSHARRPDITLVRASVGRAGSSLLDLNSDEVLVDRVRSDLRDLAKLTASPLHTEVHRWPHAMPQLEVGHPERLADARADLARLPGLAMAGASYDGIGIASCVRSAETAAATVLGES